MLEQGVDSIPAGRRDVGGIRSARRRRDPDVQPDVGARGELDAPHRGLAAGRVGVEQQHDVASERAQLAQLRLRQCRPHGGDDVVVAGLREHDHVGVALDDDRDLAARDRGASEVQAVKRRALVPERARGRVHVLGAVLVGWQAPARERDRATAAVAEGEDKAPGHAIGEPAPPAPCDAGLVELAVGEPRLRRRR